MNWRLKHVEDLSVASGMWLRRLAAVAEEENCGETPQPRHAKKTSLSGFLNPPVKSCSSMSLKFSLGL